METVPPNWDALLSFQDGSLIKKIKLSERGIFSSGVTCRQLKTFYIATLDGTCVCMCQESDDVKWRLKLEAPVFASPVLMDEHVIFTEVIGRLNCCKSRTGEKVWNRISFREILFFRIFMFNIKLGNF